MGFGDFSLRILELVLKPIDLNGFCITVKWYVILLSVNMAIAFVINMPTALYL
ncbi:MAG: hypothetical protein ACI9VT_001969 [Psychroserpens sp.]